MARIARSGGVPESALRAGISAGVSDPAETAALLLIAASPGTIGDYRADPAAGVDLAALRRRCVDAGGADAGVLTALRSAYPGFAARALGRVLRAPPGALAPILAWSSRSTLDVAQTTRRIRGLGLYGRDVYLAVATVSVDRSELPRVEDAWPAK